MPFPNAIFSLVPKTRHAEVAAKSSQNQAFRAKGKALRLDVGHIRSKSENGNTLVTIGRNGDIIVEGDNISRVQCSFEINPETGFVLFYDRSHRQSSQVFGKYPFEPGRPRKVLVKPKVNEKIGFGGADRNLFLFELKWYHNEAEAVMKTKVRGGLILQENPRLAETKDDVPTELPSHRETRLHTNGEQPRIRWIDQGVVGSGVYGDVRKGLNVDDGKWIAVKTMKKPENESGPEREWRRSKAKSEVELLAKIRHPHIVGYISNEGWYEDELLIFMDFKQGNLQNLMQEWDQGPKSNIRDTVCHQMLQALDFLATKGIVHRDIKPDNILYNINSDGYCFCLGDFGLSSYELLLSSLKGAPIYMAPEMMMGKQTHKSDIWSLFVTLLWTTENAQFHRLLKTKDLRADCSYEIITEAAMNEPAVNRYQAMARIDPNERASAAQMLLTFFGGLGLTTPKRVIPHLSNTQQPPAVGQQRWLSSQGFQAPAGPRIIPPNSQPRVPDTPQNQRPLRSREPSCVENDQPLRTRRGNSATAAKYHEETPPSQTPGGIAIPGAFPELGEFLGPDPFMEYLGPQGFAALGNPAEPGVFQEIGGPPGTDDIPRIEDFPNIGDFPGLSYISGAGTTFQGQ
ncbi:hypothetical protein NUW58_g1652 [Xylaria curta]|uniref:Uncharacterized protein n=1 Tax=Xylaria curta TaxID=42375 RepID=A0ACC1PKF4_9PEZI|nr:hypothetical protein NUW58_g1652 [Xylaria curta]